jgi:hypothetical protein
MGKHVIILGAGASMSSGYPLARGLRLCMTSPQHLLVWLREHFAEEATFEHVRAIMDPFESTLNLFRDGAYASVDEFGMLAKGKMQKEVQELKRLMCFVLGLVNPLSRYTDSTYYFLAHHLFKRDSAQLRDDITFLTLNYDPHLELAVARARLVRHKASDESGNQYRIPAQILSGFFPGDDHWFESDGLCILKLHGTIAIEKRPETTGKILTLGQIIHSIAIQRFYEIKSCTIDGGVVPVVFPWELIGDDGHIRPAEQCPWNCEVPGIGQLRDVMTKIWAKAVSEIEKATQISFVGMSMHHYLEPGFTRLFRNKHGPVKLVIANPDIKSMDPEGFKRGEYHPRSSHSRIRSFLRMAAPEMEVVKAPVYLNFEQFIAGEVAQ